MNKFKQTACLIALSSILSACANYDEQSAVSPESNGIVAEATSQPTQSSAEPLVVQSKITSDGKLILGEKEWVYIPGLEESFRARVDTGATTSSISAVDIVPFERNDQDWVKFKMVHNGINSNEMALPVERWVRIKQSSAEGSQRRAVVNMWIQIGDRKEKTEFTLADRTHLTFPVLLGRSFFRDVAVVDVSRKYIQDKHQQQN
ncbi:ATP-dependent zinc protease family protein [Vibrio taketomensis]|uniref:ATP-dependent zinc protease family protein n=1 Tax=Vibrio taketomensis TaxID=2572923 RepID=UPI001389D8D8|nr:ATP-dependent zinc protease [Vibrio taketomensis]